MNIMYCILCEDMVPVNMGYHVITGHTPEDIRYCGGPFAACPPDFEYDDWMETVEEPPQEELDRANADAYEAEDLLTWSSW